MRSTPLGSIAMEPFWTSLYPRSPHADEVINIFALAVRHGLTAEQLKATMFAYPTGASAVGYLL